LNLRCFLPRLLVELVNLQGILVRLFAELMSNQLIFFAMRHSRSRVRVGRKVVKFSCSLVRSL
jgi:hypothetical protein